jgi:alpha-2-macroglobulin
MDARAVTTDTRVGQTTLDIMSTKALLISPQTPRFVVVGDRVQLGAAVHNNSAADLSVAVGLSASGVDLDGPAEQRVDVPAHQQRYVTWQASVPSGSTRLDLVFSASGGGFSDATKPTLGTLDNQGIPVYRYESPETVGTSGVVADNGARLEAIDLPAGMQVQQGQLKVELAPSLAAGMTDGLSYLETYPYDCTEQVISSFLPNLRLEAALKAAGSEDAALAANLKTQVNLALQKLFNRQNADGGWGWWGGMDSDVLTTAYATLGLLEARTAGYPVSDRPFNLAVTYLTQQVSPLGDLAPAQDLNRQAFLLYVLARAGSPQVSATVQLYDQRQSMGLYARAFLLRTLHSIDPQDARLKTLISDLGSAAILSATGAHWEEKSVDYWNWNSDVRSTAIILGALIETDPQDALGANAVRWLMANRKQAGRWDGTQETAWTLLALTDWVQATGELKPDYHYGVAFNGETLAEGTASPQTVRDVKDLSLDVTKLLADATNKLVFARDGTAGSLYYTAHLNLWLPVDQVAALDRGVVISRAYYRPGDLTHPVTDAKQGEVLLARLTVVAASTLHYLLVDDPLPAGMEAVDTSLNSSPQATAPDQYDWTRLGADGWGWWFFTHSELRDEKVVLSTDVLPPGTYVYTYQVRASTPGAFNVMPPTAQEFYFPEVYGRGDGSQFVIAP